MLPFRRTYAHPSRPSRPSPILSPLPEPRSPISKPHFPFYLHHTHLKPHYHHFRPHFFPIPHPKPHSSTLNPISSPVIPLSSAPILHLRFHLPQCTFNTIPRHYLQSPTASYPQQIPHQAYPSLVISLLYILVFTPFPLISISLTPSLLVSKSNIFSLFIVVHLL